MLFAATAKSKFSPISLELTSPSNAPPSSTVSKTSPTAKILLSTFLSASPAVPPPQLCIANTKKIKGKVVINFRNIETREYIKFFILKSTFIAIVSLKHPNAKCKTFYVKNNQKKRLSLTHLCGNYLTLIEPSKLASALPLVVLLSRPDGH